MRLHLTFHNLTINTAYLMVRDKLAPEVVPNEESAASQLKQWDKTTSLRLPSTVFNSVRHIIASRFMFEWFSPNQRLTKFKLCLTSLTKCPSGTKTTCVVQCCYCLWLIILQFCMLHLSDFSKILNRLILKKFTNRTFKRNRQKNTDMVLEKPSRPSFIWDQ